MLNLWREHQAFHTWLPKKKKKKKETRERERERENEVCGEEISQEFLQGCSQTRRSDKKSKAKIKLCAVIRCLSVKQEITETFWDYLCSSHPGYDCRQASSSQVTV